jgi:hypothetical protein
MILTPSIFKEIYNIQIEEKKVVNAINSATQYLFRLIKRREEFKINENKDSLLIKLREFYPLSLDLSTELKKSDIELFEVDREYVTYTIPDANVTSIEFIELDNDNIVKLNFSQTYPTTGRTLIARFNMSRVNIYSDEKIDMVRRFLALKTFNMLSKDVLLNLNQNGITSWDLNGVSVAVDNNGLQELANNNEREMKDIYDNIMPLIMAKTRHNNMWLGSKRR